MADGADRFTERLAVPVWMWAAGLALAALLAAEVHLGYSGVRAWVPYVVLLPGTAALLWWLGRLRITVADGELQVDDARLPVALLSGAEPLDAARTRRALGPELHPYAFVVQRPWVRTAVRLTLDDPADPTPYWLVSTRHPQALVAALAPPELPGAVPRADGARDRTPD